MYTQLITSAQLSAIIDLPELIVLDASIPPIADMLAPAHSWPETIIPAARRFDLNKQFSDLSNSLPHTMLSVAQFTEQAQQLGIKQNSQIVVYDHFGIFSSARAWWMFKAMGHKNVAVLNGGLPLWLKENLAVVSADETQHHALGDFIGCYNAQYFCDSDKVLAAIMQDKAQVLDARSSSRFLGQEPEPRAGVRSGHMPNAVNLHYKSLQQNGCLVASEQLKLAFAAADITSEQLIMSCGSGVTACILALAADILGYKNIQVYDGSWSEWGADQNLPIET
jgi:thiosulfate/3-mercaptopyruvate sulfurtransferase